MAFLAKCGNIFYFFFSAISLVGWISGLPPPWWVGPHERISFSFFFLFFFLVFSATVVLMLVWVGVRGLWRVALHGDWRCRSRAGQCSACTLPAERSRRSPRSSLCRPRGWPSSNAALCRRQNTARPDGFPPCLGGAHFCPLGPALAAPPPMPFCAAGPAAAGPLRRLALPLSSAIGEGEREARFERSRSRRPHWWHDPTCGASSGVAAGPCRAALAAIAPLRG